MSAALTWLNDLAQWFGRWIPRLVLIQPTHAGVRFGPRGGATAVGPGLVLYWPITHALIEVPVTTQSVYLCAQLLPHDAAGILPTVRIIGAAIQYRVVNPVLAATEALNLHALVDNRAQAAIARNAKKFQSDEIAHGAKGDLESELSEFGVSVERLDLTQGGIGIALKNVGDWGWSDNAAGKRES